MLRHAYCYQRGSCMSWCSPSTRLVPGTGPTLLSLVVGLLAEPSHQKHPDCWWIWGQRRHRLVSHPFTFPSDDILDFVVVVVIVCLQLLREGFRFRVFNLPRKRAKENSAQRKALCLTVIKTHAYCARMLMKCGTYALRFIVLEHLGIFLTWRSISAIFLS